MIITTGRYVSLEVAPWGFPVSVHADIDPGAAPTFTDPGYDAEVCISSAYVGGINIYEMLDSDQLTRLEQAVIRALDL